MKKGFTLAEVLITLGIIGIIAAMTIPTIIQNTNESSTVTALKKSYSTLSQAYAMTVKENGTPDEWGLVVGGAGALQFLNTISPSFKISKNCGRKGGCFPSVIYKKLSGANEIEALDTNEEFAKVRLDDGVSYAFGINSPECLGSRGLTQALHTVCGLVYVDVNGEKSPNKYGVDMFNFYITKEGIIPTGTQQQTSSFTFDYTCKDKSVSTTSGYGCTAWVIYNENMDYLKPGCTDLAWGLKEKCN